MPPPLDGREPSFFIYPKFLFFDVTLNNENIRDLLVISNINRGYFI